jgi:type I restriction enzyme, R subunit
MRLHPYNIAQKTEIMVEHFNTMTRHKIGGRAKAMVVTGSMLEAVRYKLSFDKYIREKKYTWINTLVAFSGEVEDDRTYMKYTEVGMNNGIPYCFFEGGTLFIPSFGSLSGADRPIYLYICPGG